MKKFLIATMILAAALIIQAAETQVLNQYVKAPPAPTTAQLEEKSVPVMVCFWFDTPAYAKTTNVYGFKTGQVVSSGLGHVYGLEASWLISATDIIGGLQTAGFVCMSKELDGLQAAIPLCMNKQELNGVQASVVNIAENFNGFQPGAVNIAGDVYGFQLAALSNVSKDLYGTQLGVFNLSNKLSGFQFSAVNISDGGDGCQVGVVNVCNRRGLQFGLVNYIRDGWMPFMLGFNYSWKIVRHLE